MDARKPTANPWARAPVHAIPSSLRLADDVFGLVAKPARIIDVGCGTGRTCFEFFARGWVDVAGIDINPSVIAVARSRAQELGIPAERFHVGDARDTGLPGGSYDLAILRAVLTVIDTAAGRLAALQECRRLLRPGGKLHLADFLQAWHNPLYRVRYEEGFARYGEEGTFLASEQNGEFEYVAHHFSEREVVEALSKSGFEVEAFRTEPVITRSGNRIFGFVAACS